MKEYGVNKYYMYIDIKAVYDSIDRAELFKTMEEFQATRKLSCLLDRAHTSLKLDGSD